MSSRTKVWRAATVGVFLIAAMPSSAIAQAGALDTSFSGDGRVTTNLTTGYDYAVGLVIQSDGKLVAAGPASGGGGRFALVRYEADGGVDGTFSSDGKVFTNFTPGDDFAIELMLQADGKIVAVGGAGGAGGKFALARYRSDGTLDPTFGGDGRVVTNFTAGNDFAFGVALQADGRIVAAGRAGGLGGRFAAARYNDDGSLDPSFGGDGRVTTNFTRGDDRIDQVAIQADAKIVVAGTAGYFSRDARFAVARYLPDGGLDPSFSGDGRVTTNFTPGFDGAFSVAIQAADQKIVAAGQAGGRMALVRYNVGGTLDSSFSGDGKVTTNFTTGLDYADDVALAADGKIVAVGSANYFGASRFALARYTLNGRLDATFGGDGKVTTNFTPGWDGAFNVEIQPVDGKIVAAGGAGNRGAKFALARYLAG